MGEISNEAWVCEAQHLASSLPQPQDFTLPSLKNRFERDVFCLARTFIDEEWTWYRYTSRDAGYQLKDWTEEIGEAYSRLFEPGRFEQADMGSFDQYSCCFDRDLGKLCPPAVIELFHEVFSETEIRPSAEEAANRLKAVLLRCVFSKLTRFKSTMLNAI